MKKEGAASQPVISIDSLAPAAIERKAESIGVTKNALTLSRLIPLALAAGFFIGLGGLYFTLFVADSSLSFAVQRFAGALMFSLGLALVIICGAELFTGNSLMIGALASRKIPVGGMLRNWIWVWIFNLVGAVILVTLVYLSDTPKLGQMGATMMKIAAGKVSLGWGTLFFKGILCNVLVCLAVWMGFAAHSVADKILADLHRRGGLQQEPPRAGEVPGAAVRRGGVHPQRVRALCGQYVLPSDGIPSRFERFPGSRGIRPLGHHDSGDLL